MKTVVANGRLTKRPIQPRSGDVGALCTMVVDHHIGSGEVEPEYIDLLFPAGLAATVLEHGKVGDEVLVHGKERLKTYNGKSGRDRMNEIFVLGFEFISHRRTPQRP